MAGDYLLVCVDGTGPYSEGQYQRDFQFSYLNQIGNHLGASGKYFPGPGTLGQTTYMTAYAAATYIVNYWVAHQGADIYLAGYSRGGVAVMEAAKMCARWSGVYKAHRGEFVPASVPIRAMFLLDPVRGWDAGCSGHLSNNVAEAYVMYRDKSIVEYDAPISAAEYEDWKDKSLVKTVFGYVDPDRYARKFMENAEVTNEGGNSVTQLVRSIRIIGASHGAMGGLPWVERREDQAPTKVVGDVLKGWCGKYSIPVHLMDCSYTAATMAMIPALPEVAIRKYMRHKLSQAQKAAAEWKAFQEYRATYNLNYTD